MTPVILSMACWNASSRIGDQPLLSQTAGALLQLRQFLRRRQAGQLLRWLGCITGPQFALPKLLLMLRCLGIGADTLAPPGLEDGSGQIDAGSGAVPLLSQRQGKDYGFFLHASFHPKTH